VNTNTPPDDLMATMDGLGRVEVPGTPGPIDVGYTIQILAQAPGQPEPPGGGPFLTRVLLRARVADLFHWYTEHLIITSPDGDALGRGMIV
jgi:hypothetical protein